MYTVYVTIHPGRKCTLAACYKRTLHRRWRRHVPNRRSVCAV